MQTEKKHVHMTRQKSRAVSQITLDNDWNVPDRKPDIRKLILDQGEIQMEEARPEKDRVVLKGCLAVHILYLSAEGTGRMQSLEGQLPFEEAVHIEDLEGGETLKIDWDVEDLNVSAVNSRKISIRSVVSFTVTAEELYDEELTCAAGDEPDIQVKKKEVRVLKLAVSKKDTLRVKDEVLLTGSQANIAGLLWKEMQLQGTEVRQLEGKLSVQGELSVFALYQGEQEEQAQWAASVLPFAGMVDCAGCAPELVPDIRVSLAQRELEPKPDYDGEQRIFQAQAVLELDIRMYQEETVEILDDAYSLAGELVLKKEPVKLDTLLLCNHSKARCSQRIRVRQEDLAVLQICHCSGKAVIEEVHPTSQGLEAEGVVLVQVLYVTSSDSMPFGCAKGEVPFRHVLEATDMDGTCTYSLWGEAEQVTASMADSDEAEIRVTLGFHLLARRPKLEETVREIEELPVDYGKLQELPGIVGYIAGSGDDLWEIAKRYRTTVEEIRRMNHLPAAAVKPGEKILVMKAVNAGAL